MNHALHSQTELKNILFNSDNSLIKKTALILAGALLLAIASQISIPLQPIPLTFQSVTVVLIGMAFGPRYGTYAIACYLFAGAMGLPVFADFTPGFIAFKGPTIGYILGFLPAAFLSGYLAQKGLAKSVIGSFIAATLGVSVIFFFGVTILSQFIGMEKAISLGLMLFIFTEPFKLLAAAFVIPRLWKQI